MNNNKIKINNNIKETDYPFITVKVDGKRIKYPECVSTIATCSQYNKISMLEIHAENHLGIFDDIIVSDTDTFTTKSDIEVWLGATVNSEDCCIFKGEIIELGISEMGKRLNVSAKHIAEKMTKERKLHNFENKPADEIINSICHDYGIKLDMDPLEKKGNPEKDVQYNVTDWDFINIIAERNGLLVFTTPEGISVKRPDAKGNIALCATQEDNIVDIEINNDSRYSHKNYTVHAWNYTEQETDESYVNNTSTVSENDDNDSGEDMTILSMSSQEDTYATETYQEALSMRNDLSYIRGKMTLLGQAPVLPNDTIQIKQVWKEFDTNVIASKVIQLITTEEWQTLIEFGYDDTPYMNRYDDVIAKPSQGTIPGVNGLQLAKVEGIGEDPLGEERIYIRLLDSADTKIWARIATLDAGNQRGTFFMPEIGDEVIVGFIDDNPNQAVILGMLHSSQAPNHFQLSDDNHIKGYVSREKIIIQFDDEKKAVSIETPGGNKVLISDEDKGISMEDQNGNTLILNDQGITIESKKALTIKAAQDVTIEGNNVNIKANTQLKATGSASAELSASGNTVVKGAMVQIN